MLVQHPLAEFTLTMALILISPILARRIRIPELVLLLGFGAILGPNGIHLLERGDAVQLYGDIGKIYIMFLAGLEIDHFQFKKNGHRSGIFGLTTFAIPQIGGTVIIYTFFDYSLGASILIASMFASHTLIAYPIATRLGIARSEPVSITVGATVITDTLALIVLAIIADTARGSTPGVFFWITIFGGLLILSSAILLLIPFLTRRFFRTVSEEGNMQFLFVFTLTCGFSYLSYWARLEPIIGAFFCGIAFSRLIPEQSVLMNKIEFAGNTLFIPFFLLSSGMLISPAVLFGDTTSMTVAAAMTLTVIVSKFLASLVAGTIFSYPPAAIPLMFGLSVPQAAATLAAAMVGFELGIFDSTVLNGTMAMILVTCPLGSFFVERAGRTYALSLDTGKATPPKEERVLLPVTHTSSASHLLDLAFLYRHKESTYEVHPLSVVTDDGSSDEAVSRGESLLAYCMNHAAGAEHHLHPEMRLTQNPVDGITLAAREIRASLVISGWSEEHRLSSRIFGSISGSLVDTCPTRLMFARIVRPLSTTKRLFLLFPPLTEERPDRTLILMETKNLSQQIGVSMEVYTVASKEHPFYDEIEDILGTAVKTTIHTHRNWSSIKQSILNHLTHEDTILTALERHRGLLWSPAVDRFPEIITEKFPHTNMLLLYTPLTPLPFGDTSENTTEPPPFFEPIQEPTGTPLPQVLTALAENISPSKEDSMELFGLLMSCAEAYPVEISPGIVLLHAHTCTVTTPRVFLFHQEKSETLTPIDKKVRLLIIVLNPFYGDAQQHLKTLARIARIFAQKENQEAVETYADAESLISHLKISHEKDTPSHL
ncbi:cation:proton antiporter [Chitinivibrio alkaliphilus]|uniref:Sodium/hydrogen exchanger n=1 Tax=Chitinivibrio alkaliphilus ACht1 TaxID=1313304 RepID=U7D4W1_9BACT|nr:cation:proton antiporter [Chitinivibrio alkaliphilus]ERP30978.1 sodium/hydrogen exchanger [Chitinivibrio alkaliphilus ACht1]